MAHSSSKPLLILGGGLIGLSIAHALAKQGKEIEIFSRNRNEAAGFVAAGMLAPHAEGLTDELLALGKLSLLQISKWVKEIEKDSGINCGLRQCGIIVPFRTNEDLVKYSTASHGIPLKRLELEQEIPGIEPQWKTGLLFEQDGQIDNRRRLMRALEKACVELGVKFQEGVEVKELLRNHNTLTGIKILNAEGEVKTVACEEAILCSGAWSSQLLNDLPVFPVKGQMFSIQGPKNALKKIIFGPGIYLVPREDGLIIVGATSEKDAGFKEGLNPFGQIQLQKGLKSLLPLASSWPHMERWWGFRPCTPDEGPILGRSQLQGLWLATGHYRNGVLLAAITAQILSKSICQIPLTRKEKNILQAFQWNRF